MPQTVKIQDNQDSFAESIRQSMGVTLPAPCTSMAEEPCQRQQLETDAQMRERAIITKFEQTFGVEIALIYSIVKPIAEQAGFQITEIPYLQGSRAARLKRGFSLSLADLPPGIGAPMPYPDVLLLEFKLNLDGSVTIQQPPGISPAAPLSFSFASHVPDMRGDNANHVRGIVQTAFKNYLAAGKQAFESQFAR